MASLDTPGVSQDTVFRFLRFLFHVRRRSVATINTHVAALRDPLRYSCGVFLDPRLLDLLRRSFFLQRPPSRRPRPFWSLSKVLSSLAPPVFPAAAPPRLLFRRALFLLALATGLRASQLHALSRRPAWTVFAAGDTQVSLAPVPTFLAKNERETHRLHPVVVPAWFEAGGHHPLCPVAALRAYLLSTRRASLDSLFVWPDSLRPCSRVHISRVLCETIEAADPGRCPRGQEVRRFAGSLLYLRTYSLDAVRRGGQWRSHVSFVNRYLIPAAEDAPCVAMASLPSR